ncbi:MAG TPA: hypothetical protein VGP98_04320, partial [Pyrinomonadaceae bacterium]|nr:hypothetical protein [Pyrinomonadaceae bacterium]
MRKFFLYVSLLSLLVTTTSIGFGQGRPRRVGQSTTSAPQTQTQQTETPAPAPSRPPVLGGANNPGNRPPEAQKDDGPAAPE